MQKYEAIEKGIANKDVKRLREAIGNICYTNRDLSNGEFFEAIKYVEDKGIELKDEKLIGRPTISSQKEEFTDDDYSRAVFELKKNFCDDRIKDVQTIGKKLYGKKTTPNPSNQVGKVPNQESHQHSQKSVVIGGLVAVAIVLILILILLKLK